MEYTGTAFGSLRTGISSAGFGSCTGSGGSRTREDQRRIGERVISTTPFFNRKNEANMQRTIAIWLLAISMAFGYSLKSLHAQQETKAAAEEDKAKSSS